MKKQVIIGHTHTITLPHPSILPLPIPHPGLHPSTPHPMAMQDCDALSDDDLPQERQGCHHGGQSDLVVKCLNWQVVHLHRTETTIVKVEPPVE